VVAKARPVQSWCVVGRIGSPAVKLVLWRAEMRFVRRGRPRPLPTRIERAMNAHGVMRAGGGPWGHEVPGVHRVLRGRLFCCAVLCSVLLWCVLCLFLTPYLLSQVRL